MKKINLKMNARDFFKSLAPAGFALFLFFTFSSCEKEGCQDPANPNCENYDPCYSKTKADASFTSYELLEETPSDHNVGFKGEDVATDTIISTNFALFKADYDAEYFEWSVGTDPRVWNDREFALRFSSVPYYTPIEVRLKVYKKTDISCFPGASDTAVFTRTLVTVPRDSSRVKGRFQGYLESKPTESNFFEIDLIKDQRENDGIAVSGITPNCSMNNNQMGSKLLHSVGYRSLYFTSNSLVSCCLGLSGFATVSTKGAISMDIGKYPPSPQDSCDWTYLEDPAYTNDIFFGTKL